VIKKILFAATEMVPFIKTGGLGEVIGSLPLELKHRGLDGRVIMPLYKNLNHDLEFIGEFMIFDDWRKHSAKIYKTLVEHNLIVYFLENNYYFTRDKIYGYHDDFERFAFFSYGLLNILEKINFKPEIINFNDWQTALGCLYSKKIFSKQKFYEKIKSVFTIHNLQYQGVFDKSVLNSIMLSDFDYLDLEFYGKINFMKAGLNFADIINTVSLNYAQEIQMQTYGYGLDGVLREHKNKLFGILNGIDYKKYDSKIFGFDSRDLSGKILCKKKLCEKFNLEFKKNSVIMCVISRFAEQKGLDIIYHALQDIFSLDIKLIILGSGEDYLEKLFINAQDKFNKNLRVNIGFDDLLAQEIYAGSDMLLMPSRFEPCGLTQLIAMRYGTVPIARETGGLADTISDFININLNQVNKTNGFLFKTHNAQELLLAIKRALDIFNNHDKIWKKIMLNAMSCDYSWAKSAQEYIKLYNLV